jgi:hypothetical protein
MVCLCLASAPYGRASVRTSRSPAISSPSFALRLTGGLEVTAEYVLDGLSAWTGAHREQLRQALDDARVGRYEVMLITAARAYVYGSQEHS